MNFESKSYYSNGKLLLTGEYVVLDGAKALAIPSNYGQGLNITTNNSDSIKWCSLNELGRIWYEDTFEFKNSCLVRKVSTMVVPVENRVISNRLINILNAVIELRPKFASTLKGLEITTKLNFNKQWGLGSSSSLINNIAKWADVNAYDLLKLTFGGSGFDIACAQSNFPITYRLNNGTPHIETVQFSPYFTKYLYFVYLNKKQNSRSGIATYKTLGKVNSKIIEAIDKITTSIILCESLETFEGLITEHEHIISKVIQQQPIKQALFKDFKGGIKSLGAWGGDFILATSKENPKSYFSKKGFDTVIPYQNMIKK